MTHDPDNLRDPPLAKAVEIRPPAAAAAGRRSKKTPAPALAGRPTRVLSDRRREGQAITGRPSCYTDELADEICELLADGESLNAICRDERMPSRKVVHEWIADDRNGFRDRYVRAREAQAEYWASEIIEISDSVRKGASPNHSSGLG